METNDPTRSEAPSVVDVTAAWGESLATEAAKDPAKVKAVGSARSLPPSAPVEDDDYSRMVREGRKIQPMMEKTVKGMSSILSTTLRVDDISHEQIVGVAEPASQLMAYFAPNTPPWVFPLSVLGSQVVAIYNERVEQFQAQRPKPQERKGGSGNSEPDADTTPDSADAEPGIAPSPQLVGPGEF